MAADCGSVKWCGCESVILMPQRDLLRVEQGKGRKDRYTLLGPRLLGGLTSVLAGVSPDPSLAVPAAAQTSADGSRHRAEALLCGQATGRHHQGRRHSRSAPCLRHAFVEAGTDFATLQQLLGHDSVTTTMRYVHVARTRAASRVPPWTA